MSAISRETTGHRRARITRLAATAAVVAGASLAAPASAQDLVFHFVDPSFGGNPFYSDHLLATAAVDRPSAPTTPTTTQTIEEQTAATLRAQLLSSLSGNILTAITNAKPGDSNTYTFGDQIVSYKTTATETDVTFTNTNTGAVNTVVIPSSSLSSSSSSSTTAAAIAAARASAAATSTNIALSGSLTGVTSTLPSASASRSAEQILSASSAATGSGAVLPPL